MNKLTFEDATKISDAYITIDDKNYIVTAAKYKGKIPLSSQNLNKLQDNIEEAITINRKVIKTETEIAENTNYTIPLYYQVGNNSLEIVYMGEKLIKDIHYKEIGDEGTISNTIQFFDWGMNVPTGRTIEFVVRGEYNAS